MIITRSIPWNQLKGIIMMRANPLHNPQKSIQVGRNEAAPHVWDLFNFNPKYLFHHLEAILDRLEVIADNENDD